MIAAMYATSPTAGMYHRATNRGNHQERLAASPPASSPANAPASPGDRGAPALRARSSAASGAIDMARMDATQRRELLPTTRADHMAVGEARTSQPMANASASIGTRGAASAWRWAAFGRASRTIAQRGVAKQSSVVASLASKRHFCSAFVMSGARLG